MILILNDTWAVTSAPLSMSANISDDMCSLCFVTYILNKLTSFKCFSRLFFFVLSVYNSFLWWKHGRSTSSACLSLTCVELRRTEASAPSGGAAVPGMTPGVNLEAAEWIHRPDGDRCLLSALSLKTYHMLDVEQVLGSKMTCRKV